MSTEQQRQEWRKLAERLSYFGLEGRAQSAITALLADVDALTQERDALAAELATERALTNMVPKYVRYLAAWRVGDGRFLVFNEWVEQQVAQPQAAHTPTPGTR